MKFGNLNLPEGAPGELIAYWLRGMSLGWRVESLEVVEASVYEDGTCRSVAVEPVITTPRGGRWRGTVSLYMPVVNVVTIVTERETGRQFAALVIEERPMTLGSVLGNPSGRVDKLGEPLAKAAIREVEEEVSDQIDWGEAIDLNARLGSASWEVSPGVIFEQVCYFLVETALPARQIEELRGSSGGVVSHEEHTTVQLISLDMVFAVLANVNNTWKPDAKSLEGWMLYRLLYHKQ